MKQEVEVDWLIFVNRETMRRLWETRSVTETIKGFEEEKKKRDGAASRSAVFVFFRIVLKSDGGFKHSEDQTRAVKQGSDNVFLNLPSAGT